VILQGDGIGYAAKKVKTASLTQRWEIFNDDASEMVVIECVHIRYYDLFKT
jgi:hypothetical protein